jgi:hypothetical protein
VKSGHFFRGVLLIAAGVLLLLANVGYLKPYFWWQLIQLWPVLLIAFGLRLMGRDTWTINLAVLALLAGTIGYAVWISQTDAAVGPKSTSRINQSWSQGIETADLTVNFGDGRIKIHEGSTELARGVLDYYRDEPKWEFSQEGDRAFLEITQEELRSNSVNIPSIRKQIREWDIALHYLPEWNIKFNAGACTLDADLTSLKVNNLQVNTGASDIKIKMGNQSVDGTIVVKAGASNVQLSFPEEAGVKVDITGALSNNNLTEAGFVKVDDSYFSPGYENAEYFYNLEMSVGVSNIMILRY